MISQIADLIATAVGAASELMLLVFERTGTTELVLAALVILVLARILLGPLTGFSSSPFGSFISSVSKSDKARRSDHED